MTRLCLFLTTLLFATSALAASTTVPDTLRDLYFGEALYHAFLGEWFDAVARLDIELEQHHGVDQPELDSLSFHLGQAEFAVGDFELAYRMHRRAGRAISAVIEGQVPEPVRNEALFRLARIYFQKDQPETALQVVERIAGAVPAGMRSEVTFLRAQILMVNGRFAEAAGLLDQLQQVPDLAGFASYNLGIALLRDGREQAGRQALGRTGLLAAANPETLAIRDKANLVLGDQLLEEGNFDGAKEVLDRVRLRGPFSNRALLSSGWVDASAARFDRALVPWSLLVEGEATDSAVQEGLLAVPYAYGKLGVHGRAALLYGRALEVFGGEIEKLGASMESIRKGSFLQALARKELQQDANWVVKLRQLPESPETYYLLDLLASNDFQESLKNYLDLDQLAAKLTVWEGDLDTFEELIADRRAYYQPLLPAVDTQFRRLDSQLRLRLEQRARIEGRLQAMLTAPRPEALATAQERLLRERLGRLEQALAARGAAGDAASAARIQRLRGVLYWNIRTDYDGRLTRSHENLAALNGEIAQLQRQYQAFVRTRQAATQGYQGYAETIRRQRLAIAAARDTVVGLMARQGQLLEVMAVAELGRRRERLEEFQVKARFALADSYDRAARNQGRPGVAP